MNKSFGLLKSSSASSPSAALLVSLLLVYCILFNAVSVGALPSRSGPSGGSRSSSSSSSSSSSASSVASLRAGSSVSRPGSIAGGGVNSVIKPQSITPPPAAAPAAVPLNNAAKLTLMQRMKNYFTPNRANAGATVNTRQVQPQPQPQPQPQQQIQPQPQTVAPRGGKTTAATAAGLAVAGGLAVGAGVAGAVTGGIALDKANKAQSVSTQAIKGAENANTPAAIVPTSATNQDVPAPDQSATLQQGLIPGAAQIQNIPSTAPVFLNGLPFPQLPNSLSGTLPPLNPLF